MTRQALRIAAVAFGAATLLATGGCVTSPKQTVLNLDTTDRKWTSRRCVQARKAVYEYDEHGNARRALSIGGNLAVPFAGTAASLAWSKSQDRKRAQLNARVETACVTKKKVRTAAKPPAKKKEPAKKRRG